MILTYSAEKSTANHYVFYDENGNKYAVGKAVGTQTQARNLLLNPPPAVVAGIKPPNIDFELGISDEDQKNFAADIIGFMAKLRRNGRETDTVKIADKTGVLHEITVADYITALDYYHSVLRSAWLASKGG